MRHENGEWMLQGTEASDPSRIRDPEGLIAYVEQAGFLPLFQNEIPGFSVEEHTLAADWWTGDPERDPWEWRSIAARSHRVAYGKFFSGKAGFLSLEWLPFFVNDILLNGTAMISTASMKPGKPATGNVRSWNCSQRVHPCFPGRSGSFWTRAKARRGR